MNTAILVLISTEGVMPMIPLGLKETNDINFVEPFSDFILEHYSEDPLLYVEAIADITDTRKVSNSIRNIYQYSFNRYNHIFLIIYYVEGRTNTFS